MDSTSKAADSTKKAPVRLDWGVSHSRSTASRAFECQIEGGGFPRDPQLFLDPPLVIAEAADPVCDVLRAILSMQREEKPGKRMKRSDFGRTAIVDTY